MVNRTVSLNIIDRSFTDRMKDLSSSKRRRRISGAAKRVANEVTKLAAKAAPVESGTLSRSGKNKVRTVGDVIKAEILFRTRYAKFQNEGLPGTSFIFPRRAKYLYVALTSKGRNRARGAKFGKDYVLAKKVRVPKPGRFGRKKGPNQYVDGAIRKLRRSGFIRQTMLAASRKRK